MPNVQPIPTWLHTPPTSRVLPPVLTRKHDLPFGELAWEDFERLCLRLVRCEADVEHCQLYGVRGDEQGGIDIFARTVASSKYQVYQCKREADFGPAKIESAVEKFLGGSWKDKSDRFVLCTKESLRNKQRADAFEKQRELLKLHGITLVPWDSDQLSLQLKDHQDLVDDFFGREWLRSFCGEEAADRLECRLAPERVGELRLGLGQFYRRVFNTQDPGLPRGELSERAVLAIEQRFVFPDIVNRRPISFPAEASEFTSNLPRPAEAQSGRYFDPTPPSGQPRQADATTRILTERTGIDNWLGTATRALVLGEPGSGKSTLLRFLAIDLLQPAPRMQACAQRWGCHLPVWMPFALWTATVSRTPNQSSLTDVLHQWLRSFDEDRLWPLVSAALNDDRLLLLVDGLDEFASEEAAGIALTKLQVFVDQRSVPVIATSRPHGFRKLIIPADRWQIGHLAEFTGAQQKQLVKGWMAHSRQSPEDSDSSDADNRQNQINFETDSFMAELQRSSDLLDLAKVPLLLLLLIYHRLQRSALPNGRFKAYESMVEHLVATHPHRRRVAASVNNNGFDLSDDEVARALACLAFHLQCHSPNGVIDQQAAVTVLAEFLRDDQRGLGFAPSDAHRLSRRLVDVAEGTIGLLVRRSNREISFFHRTFQEYLAALHLFESPLEEQTARVTKHCGDPQWHETLLCLFHLTRRRPDLASFVDAIEQEVGRRSVSQQHEIDALLAEIAFGNFTYPPERARKIADAVYAKIERGDWMPQRERLLRIALDGYKVGAVKESVKEKLLKWFPCRIRWRGGLYAAISHWPASEEVIQCLVNGIHDDEESNQRSAAEALQKVAAGDERIGNELVELAGRHPRPSVRAVCLEALTNGWPDHKALPSVIAAAHRSISPDLRLISILGRIKAGEHNDADRDALLALAFPVNTPYTFRDLVVQAMLEGWPKCGVIRKACLESVVAEGPWQVDPTIAIQVLIRAFPGDPDVANACAREIREKEHPFVASDFRWTLAMLAKGFQDNENLSGAVDEWLEKQEFNWPSVYQAALLTRSDRAKRKLLSLLDGGFPHWSAGALLEVWGLEDRDVAEALTAIAFGDNPRAATIAILLPRIIRGKDECRARLLELLRDATVRRPDFVLDALCDLRIDDIDIVDLVLTHVLPRADMSDLDVAEIKGTLISTFPDNARVKALATAELDRRVDDLGSPGIARIAQAYRGDAAIRKRILQTASPLPDQLRSVLVSQLRTSLPHEPFGLEVFGAYDHEEDNEIKTASSIAYHERLRSSGKGLESALRSLSEAICCYGPDHEARRQAAFCGLLELDRLDIIQDAHERIGDSRLCAITLYSRLASGPNIPLVHCLLGNWARLKSKFGETFWPRFSKGADGPQWHYLWEFADKYEQPREEGIEFIESRLNKCLDAAALRFLARSRPQSRLLMQCCLETLQIHNNNVDVSGVNAVTAAEILGTQFEGNQELLGQVLSAGRHDHFYGKKILAVCEAFPEHSILREAYDWARKERGRCAIEVYVRLICRVGATEEVDELVTRICATTRLPPQSYLLFCRPLVRRIASDAELAERLLSRLQRSPAPSEKASLSRLLPASTGSLRGFREWAEFEVQRQVANPEVGLDIAAGELRPVLHAILDGSLQQYSF